MGTHNLSSFLLATLIVVLLILGWAAAQGLGVAFTHGVQEWLVR